MGLILKGRKAVFRVEQSGVIIHGINYYGGRANLLPAYIGAHKRVD